MAISFSIPKSPTKSIFQMNYFQGCDFTNSPANVDDFKSPNCVNMIRDVPGKIRKCMGYHTIRRYPGAINGAFYLRSSDEQLIHAGEDVYFNDVRLYKGINNHRSKSWQFDKKLYIQDGKELLVHECKDADIKEGYTYGHHEQYVEGLTYDVNMTISSGDNVYFRFPYKLTSIVVSGVESKTINFDSPITRYVFTAGVDGAHKFTCNAFDQNVPDLSGKESFTINRDYGEDGFIDNTDGRYIDEHHLIRTVKKVADEAYVPTVTIAKEPQGGGTSYESLNLIQPGFIELFSGKENVTAYQLSFKGLDATEVIVKLLDGNGNWVTKKEGTHFSVDRTNGIINFTSAPGPSPLTGEDNVSIQAYRTVKGYADRINKCTISILFGVHGNADRLFVSGNPEYINYDWYSQQYDPTYFPDTGYSVLGSSSSAIVGYTIISNYLAAHKDDKERDSNIILREGDLVDNEPSFPIVATLQGAGAVAPWSFNYLETEPIFLTKSGIYAVTAQDITGEKYSQNRSYYIDGKLLKEENLKDAYSCVYNDFYLLAINGKLYILDGLQPIQTDKSMPYATRQYACFYRENVPANCIWTFEEKLYFGTADGRVCVFYTDKNDLYSYNDDGKAIECVWETPDLEGRYFFKNKTFRYLAVRLDSAIATSINIYTMKRGIWSLAKSDETKGRYFTFPYLNFAKFSFSTDQTQKIINSKLRIKKVDKSRFRFTNTELNEPFGIFDVALEYVESGNYKG